MSIGSTDPRNRTVPLCSSVHNLLHHGSPPFIAIQLLQSLPGSLAGLSGSGRRSSLPAHPLRCSSRSSWNHSIWCSCSSRSGRSMQPLPSSCGSISRWWWQMPLVCTSSVSWSGTSGMSTRSRKSTMHMPGRRISRRPGFRLLRDPTGSPLQVSDGYPSKYPLLFKKWDFIGEDFPRVPAPVPGSPRGESQADTETGTFNQKISTHSPLGVILNVEPQPPEGS